MKKESRVVMSEAQHAVLTLDRLGQQAHCKDAPTDVKIEYSVAKQGLETLITRLRNEGCNV